MTEKHTYTITDGPKMLRETLCLAQRHVGALVNPEHVARLGRLIDECDRKRPIGNDGKHDDRHTPECGCTDTPRSERVALTDAEREALTCDCTAVSPDWCSYHVADRYTLALPAHEVVARVERIIAAREAAVRAQTIEHLGDALAMHPMWIDDQGRPLEYSEEREALIGDFLREFAARIIGGEGQ